MALDQVHRYGHRRSRFSTPLRRRRMRVWIVAGLLMGFVALAWAWAFQRGPSEGRSGLPVLVADPQPTRQKPNDPGGLKVADIDPLSYDAGRAPPRVENILPGPDKPLPKPEPAQQPAAVTAPPAAPPVPATTALQTAAPPAGSVPTAANAPVGPPKQLAPEIAPPPTKPAVAPTAIVAPNSRPSLRPTPTTRSEAVSPTKAIAPGGYRLQLASLRSAADAREVEAKLRRSYGNVLGSVAFAIVAVNLHERGTYYRVMAGPMSEAAATQMCGSLRERGAACILARP